MDICPQCGYKERTYAQTQPHSEMHQYVTEDGKVFGVLNEREATITLTNPKNPKLDGLKLIRKDKFVAAPKVVTPETPKV